MYRGSGIKRDEVTAEGIPCVRYGEIYTTYNTWFDTCVSHTKLENVQSPKYFENGDILFAITAKASKILLNQWHTLGMRSVLLVVTLW